MFEGRDILCLIPVYLDEDEAVWLKSCGALDGLAKALAGLTSAWGPNSVLVAAETPEAAAPFSRRGLRSIRVSRLDGSWFLPPGSRGALEDLLRAGVAGQILLLDCRSAGDVAAMAQRMAVPEPDVRVSVSRPADHPAQLQQFFDYTGVGVLHVLDGPETVGRTPCMRSRPCLLPCPSSMGGEDPGRYWLAETLALDAPQVAPDPEDALAGGAALVRFGPRGCEVLFPESTLPHWSGAVLAGVPVLRLHAPAAWLLERGGEYFLRMDTEDDSLRVLVPAGSHGGGGDICLVPGPCMVLPYRPEGAVLPYVITRVTEEGFSDLTLGYEPGGKLWRRTGGTIVNLETCVEITGRQQLPECLEVNGLMAAGTVEDLLRFDDLLLSGRSRGFSSDGVLRRISSSLDWLEYENHVR